MSPRPTQADSMVLPSRLPLVVTTSNRNDTVGKDARLVNCYIETDGEQQLWIYKRPGLFDSSGVLASGAGSGTFFWAGDVYSIFGTALLRNGSPVGSVDSTGGMYKFSSILGAIPKLVLGNGVKTYAYTVTDGLSADLHTIDADFPGATVKGIAYLNGATYVMNVQAEVWGSAVNSVSNNGDWSALNFIAAQIEPDPGVALDRQLVYVIAFNAWSTEAFFDAGNPTGTPLGSVQGSKISYGCAHADSVQRVDDKLFWLSATQTASLQISMLEQLSHKVISTKAIDKLLRQANITTVYSWQLKMDGHSFYVITLKEENLTLAYDIDEDLWHQWTDTNGNYMPIVSSTYDSSRHMILQHESNGKLYYCSPSYYTDDSDTITVDIYTPTFDAGTKRSKTLSRLSYIGDQVNGSTLFFRCTDNDYQNWSNPRRLDLSTLDPFLINCGTFKRRAYHLQHKAPTAFRIQALEAQYDLGTL